MSRISSSLEKPFNIFLYHLVIITPIFLILKIIILKYVSRAVLLLCCCFVSYELGSHTLIEKDGFYPMAPFSDEFSFKEDKT